ncbi:MAG: S-layer homology domain-containing protein [Clostridia bacterium]|nr:S-layer homology domain-containing protein [Clostridia bacterium]
MKKLLSILLVVVLGAGVTCAFATNSASEWAKEEIEKATRLGFVSEELQNSYRENITRAEFAKTAVLFAVMKFNMDFEDALSTYLQVHVDQGEPLSFKADTFSDVKDTPNAYYVDWAYTLGIVEGRGDGIFDPDAPITREEAATMLLRVYFCYGSGVKLGPKSEGVDSFSDVSAISSWADTAVRYMYQWDVMHGVSDTEFDPKGTYTREQCLATFLRLNEVYSHPVLLQYGEMVSQVEALPGYTEIYRGESERYTIMYGTYKAEQKTETCLWIINKNSCGRRNVISQIPKEAALGDFILNDGDELHCEDTKTGIFYVIDLAAAEVAVLS